MIITIDTEKEELLWEAIKYGNDALSCLADMGNYLRPMALGKTDKVDDVDKIYDKFFDLMSENNLNRDIVGF